MSIPINISGPICPMVRLNKNSIFNDEIYSLIIKHSLLNGINGFFVNNKLCDSQKINTDIDSINHIVDLILNEKKNLNIFIGLFENNTESLLDHIDSLGKKTPNIFYVISPPCNEKISNSEMLDYFSTVLNSIDSSSRIFLYNHPQIFSNNTIEPEIIQSLIENPELGGIIDYQGNINYYKQYIFYLNDYFRVFSVNEKMFSMFMQIVPYAYRKYTGLISPLNNLSNISHRIYSSQIEEDPLEIVHLQDQLEEHIKNIFFNGTINEKTEIIKDSIYYLYRDYLIFKFIDNHEFITILEEVLQNENYKRIKASIGYLLNSNLIDRYYSLQDKLYNFKEFKKAIQDTNPITNFEELRKIDGPHLDKYHQKYRIKLDKDYLASFQITKKTYTPNLYTEKLLYPFLDNSLSSETPELRDKIKKLISKQKGNYIFKYESQPIISVPNLIYFDETKEIFPYIFAIHSFLDGKPLYKLLADSFEDPNLSTKPNITTLFEKIGEMIGKLHSIKFNSFYEDVSLIGKSEKDWPDVFEQRLNSELERFKKKDNPYFEDINQYFQENESLIYEEYEPVIIHNDLSYRNIVVKKGDFFKLTGLINFHNWRIGIRFLDLANLNFLTLKYKNFTNIENSIYNGYKRVENITLDNAFKKKIEFYSLYLIIRYLNLHSSYQSYLDKLYSEFFPSSQKINNFLEKIL